MCVLPRNGGGLEDGNIHISGILISDTRSESNIFEQQSSLNHPIYYIGN